MRLIASEEVDRLLGFDELIEALRLAFRHGVVQPVRHHHLIERPDGAATTLLLMPAWTDFMKAGASDGGHVGVKIVTVSPDNNALGMPAVMGVYLLLDGKTGAPVSLIDGQRLTLWRTAAASALAATYLARADASVHLVIGAGALSPFLARAHRTIRPIAKTLIWNRTPANAVRVAAMLADEGLDAEAVDDLRTATQNADIVTACTISTEPVVRGEWLKPGAHVDLVGAFSPTMRESDDDAIRRSSVHVDTRAGATKEAGDIVQAIASGAMTADDIRGDLFDLARGEASGRRGDEEITLFKSVGAAIEDLAAGMLVWRKTGS
ncbi:MAG: ornithine cyclodeaminase family protein [Phyllobacteriaceae bacterium]|nr:ornithine cyclodeaminase family protein [Phyllobacteriaceae bacterium]